MRTDSKKKIEYGTMKSFLTNNNNKMLSQKNN